MDIKILSLCDKASDFFPLIKKELRGDVVVPVSSSTFNVGEVMSYPLETVRGCDVYIVFQWHGENINSSLMRIMILSDALFRASAGKITLVAPCLPYMRQDYRSRHRQPISAKLFADLLKTAHIDHLLTFDLHAKQAEGFFGMPTDNIGFTTLLSLELKKRDDLENLVITTADVGGIERVKKLASKIDCDFVVIDKSRKKAGEVDEMKLIGEVSGKSVLIFDDMTDTGNTLIKACDTLIKNGAIEVMCGVTHLLNNKGLVKKLNESVFSQIFTTDSVFHKKLPEKFKVISLSEKIGQVVRNINNSESVDFS